MAKKKGAAVKRARQAAGELPATAPLPPVRPASPASPLPFGAVAGGIPMAGTTIPMFPPELQAELKKARDSSGGKWLILVYRAVPDDDATRPGGHAVHLHTCRGPKWEDDWLLRAYRLFVAKMLEFSGRITEFLAEPKKPEAPPPAEQPQE